MGDAPGEASPCAVLLAGDNEVNRPAGVWQVRGSSRPEEEITGVYVGGGDRKGLLLLA